MSERFFHGKATASHARNEGGSTTTVLLLVLLLVIAAGGYVYYFTDLIRPATEAPKAQPIQNSQVKQPIPSRPAQPGEAPTPKPAEAQKAPAGPSSAPAVPAATPAPPAPAAPPAKPEPPKAKTQPVPAPATAPPKALPAPAKPASAPAPPAKTASVPAKPAATPAPAKKEAAPAKPVHEKQVVKRKAGVYALEIGDFVPDKTLAAAQAKLKKSGVGPVRQKTVTAAEPMNRLFIGEFGDQDSAEAELQKLKKKTTDAFLVAQNGTYTLYAGSYFSESRVRSEMQRLAAKGVTPVVKQARIPIKVTRLTAGSYATADEAAKAAKRLKKAGITAKVIKTGR